MPKVLSLPAYEPQVLTRHPSPGFQRESRYVNEWARPQGLFDGMNVVLENATGLFAGIGLGRDERAGPYSDRDIEVARLLSPHLRRAAAVSRILDRAAVEVELSRATMDLLRVGVVLANAEGRILHANGAAETMLRAGAPISSARGTLQASHPAATAELHTAFDIAASGDEVALGRAGVAIRLTETGEAPVIAHVLPIRKRTRERGAVAAIFVNADSTNGADAVTIAYDLTPTETRVLAGLLGGLTLADIAAMLSISENTAKTHLHGIFARTGTSRQAELVALAERMAPPARRPG